MAHHTPLELFVPEPEFRPGSTPDFSGVEIPDAGVPRPDVGDPPEKMRDLAFTIIRVLNREDEAVGHGQAASATTISSRVCAT